MPFASIPEAIEDFRAGRMLVVVDDEDRENEGDLTIAAEKVTPEIINFMATHGRGLICLTLTEERCDHLRLPLMSPENTSRFRHGVLRDHRCARGRDARASRRPTGRIRFRWRSIRDRTAGGSGAAGACVSAARREGGVLVRAGQTEASVDLARMAGLIPAGVICEIMNEDGTMARVPDWLEFCERHGLKMISVADLIRYRLQNERFIHRVAEGSHVRPSSASSARSLMRATIDAGDRIWRWCMATSQARERCWCGCIRIACRAMFSARRDCDCRR